MPNFCAAGNRTRDFRTLPDDATHLAIQPPKNRLVLIEVGSQIEAGSLIEARGSDSIVLIQAGGFY